MPCDPMDRDTMSREQSDAAPGPRTPSRVAPSDRDAKKTRSSWPNEVEQLLPLYMAQIKQWPALTGKDLNDSNSMALLKTYIPDIRFGLAYYQDTTANGGYNVVRHRIPCAEEY